jgi:hypothetical protein
MGKSRTLANTVSTGGPLADGAISASEVSGLAAVATTGSYSDLTGAPAIPGAPGLELIQVHTFSGALTYNIENFSSTYDDYLLLFDAYNPGATAALSARLKVGGSYQTASSYRSHVARGSSASSAYSAWNTSTLPYIPITGALAAVANRARFAIHALDVNNASGFPSIFWSGSNSDASNLYTINGSADYPTAGALQGIQFMTGAGDTTNVGGTVRVYGYKKTA